MDVYTVLNSLGISYEEVEHEAVYTVEQAEFIKGMIEGTGCKNLFLRDNKKTKYLLVVLEDEKRADLKQIAKVAGTSSLKFASSEDLLDILGLTPGSVTPLSVINDEENKVLVMFDADLQGKRVTFHPNINTKTLAMSFEDTLRFVEYTGHKYIIF